MSNRLRRMPWGLSFRIAVGFILIIIITILAFSQILLGKIEGYLLHDMENSMAHLAITARASMEYAFNAYGIEEICNLNEENLRTFGWLTRDLAGKIGCRIILTDEQGIEVIDSRGDTFQGTGIRGQEEIEEAVGADYGADTRVDAFTGLFTMYVAYPIKLKSGKVVGVISLSRPTGSIEGLLDSIQNGILISGSIAGGVAVLLGIILAIGLAHPINRIRNASERFGKGDLNARSGVKGRSDLAELSRSFDRMADSVERSFEEMSELDRMKSDFVANVSHELRTPLTAIKGLTETLLEGAIDDKDVNRKFLLDIMAESERLLLMVNNVLNLSRIEEGALDFQEEEIRLDLLVSGVISRMRPVVELRGVSIEVEIEPGIPAFLGDSTRIDQAIANIIDNAIKYSGSSSVVRVSIGRTPGKDSDSFLVVVEDEGPGIPEDEIGHVFDRFYQADSRGAKRKGSGLGLAIAKFNIEAHKGTIEIFNRPEGGTEVRIVFPGAKPADDSE